MENKKHGVGYISALICSLIRPTDGKCNECTSFAARCKNHCVCMYIHTSLNLAVCMIQRLSAPRRKAYERFIIYSNISRKMHRFFFKEKYENKKVYFRIV